jgi:SPP1 family predicted phage head-tail adaptor
MHTLNTLTQRVTLQQPVYTANTSGGRTTTWSMVTDLWANVVAKSLTAAVVAEQKQVANRYIVTVRNIVAIEESMRLLWQGRVLRIVGLPPVTSDNLYREIECTDALTME